LNVSTRIGAPPTISAQAPCSGGPAADPESFRRGSGRLVERNEFLAADGLTFSRHRNLFQRLAGTVAATPHPRGSAMSSAADPELVCNNSRSLRDRPDQHDPEKRALARDLARGCCHRMQSSSSDGGTFRTRHNRADDWVFLEIFAALNRQQLSEVGSSAMDAAFDRAGRASANLRYFLV
jgi:hypothetical protein